MTNICQSETFCLTWKVNNFYLSNLQGNQCITTPLFRVGVLQNTIWQLEIALEGTSDPSFIDCSLIKKTCTYGAGCINLKWKLCLLAEGGAIRFETAFPTFTMHNEEMKTCHFIRKSELQPSDIPKNILAIHCQMENDPQSHPDMYRIDLETLSSDFAGLLESGFRSDFKMFCRGEIFYVHKFIILSRWPHFCETFQIENMSTREDMIMIDIASSTLSAFLSFLYTGKLEHEALSMDLCSYMHKNNCSDLLKGFETPASDLEFVTQMSHEWIYLTWEVGDESNWNNIPLDFCRIILLQKVYTTHLVVKFNFEERYKQEWLKVSLLFTRFSSEKPLLMDGEISFTNKDTVWSSSEFHHVLTSDGEWTLPWLVKKNDLLPNKTNSKRVDIRLCICDGAKETRLVSTSIINASSFNNAIDLVKLTEDICTSSYPRDMNLRMADMVYSAHSVVVAARSAKFREMIQQNSEEIEIEHFDSKEAAEAFFVYLYAGEFYGLNIETVTQLNNIARKYLLHNLEEDTREMLRRLQLEW